MSSSSRSDAPTVVVLSGSETILRDDALADLRERALGSGPRDFNEDRIDLAASDPRAVLTACHTLPIMAPRRLVVVTGLDGKRAKPFVEDLLPAYLEAPVETACLVLCTAKVDRRLRWVKRAAKLGAVISCDPPKRSAEQRSWIEARMRARGKRPGRGAATTLLELIGPDLDRLSFEIEKACLFVGDAEEVGADDVSDVTANLRPLAVYELTDAIGGKRLPEALRVLARLQTQGEAPLRVLAVLANHFRQLLRAHDCRLNPGKVQQELSVHPYVAKKLTEQAPLFEPPRLLRCMAAVRRTDEVLKGAVPLAPALAIEQLVVSVCS